MNWFDFLQVPCRRSDVWIRHRPICWAPASPLISKSNWFNFNCMERKTMKLIDEIRSQRPINLIELRRRRRRRWIELNWNWWELIAIELKRGLMMTSLPAALWLDAAGDRCGALDAHWSPSFWRHSHFNSIQFNLMTLHYVNFSLVERFNCDLTNF